MNTYQQELNLYGSSISVNGTRTDPNSLYILSTEEANFRTDYLSLSFESLDSLKTFMCLVKELNIGLGIFKKTYHFATEDLEKKPMYLEGNVGCFFLRYKHKTEKEDEKYIVDFPGVFSFSVLKFVLDLGPNFMGSVNRLDLRLEHMETRPLDEFYRNLEKELKVSVCTLKKSKRGTTLYLNTRSGTNKTKFYSYGSWDPVDLQNTTTSIVIEQTILGQRAIKFVKSLSQGNVENSLKKKFVELYNELGLQAVESLSETTTLMYAIFDLKKADTKFIVQSRLFDKGLSKPLMEDESFAFLIFLNCLLEESDSDTLVFSKNVVLDFLGMNYCVDNLKRIENILTSLVGLTVKSEDAHEVELSTLITSFKMKLKDGKNFITLNLNRYGFKMLFPNRETIPREVIREARLNF